MILRNSSNRDNRVLAVLQKLKHNDPVEVTWIDASTSDVLSINLPFASHVVETRQHEIGWFLTLQKGDTWRDLHLLFYTRSLDNNTRGARWSVTSVPVVLVREVRPLAGKQALKAMKDRLTRKIGRRHRRHTQRFSDGSVKHVD